MTLYVTEFGVHVEPLAPLPANGVCKARRLVDGEIISVAVKELTRVVPLTEADQPRELFKHTQKIWRDPADV